MSSSSSSSSGSGGSSSFSQTTKLLVGIGTLAAGFVSLAASGFKLTKNNKDKQQENNTKDTATPYFDDLNHLSPPWQQLNGASSSSSFHGTPHSFPNADEAADAVRQANSNSDSSFHPSSMDSQGFGHHRDLENESKELGGRYRRTRSARGQPDMEDYSVEDELAREAARKTELESWEALNEQEEQQLTFKFDARAFANIPSIPSSVPLPLPLLSRLSFFLPFESLIVMSSVNRAFNAFYNQLIDDTGVQWWYARANGGFNEVFRGPIWLRLSGAGRLARRMSIKATPESDQSFYDFLLHKSIAYRKLIVMQNSAGGLRNTAAAKALAAAAAPSLPNSPSPSPSSPFDGYEIDGLSPESRSSLDTILKDVPRTVIPSNPASSSLLNNNSGVIDDNDSRIVPAHQSSAAVVAALSQQPEQQLHSHNLQPPSVDVVPSSPVSSSISPSSSSHLSESAQRALASHHRQALNALSNVLSVYALHDHELGYCQGMNFVAYFFLTKLQEYEAYWLFHSVMNDPKWHFRTFYLNDLQGLLLCKYQLDFLFRLYLPELYAHFEAQDVHSDIFTEMLMTFFTYVGFPRRYPTLDRIWDLILIGGGTKIMFRVVLSILYLSQQTLFELEFEDIIHYLKTLPDDGILEPTILMNLVCDHFKVSNAALAEIEKRYLIDINPAAK